MPFRINREALPILVYLLYRSSKPLHTEKAGSKGTGILRRIWMGKRARRERSDKERHCRALRRNSDGVYDSNEQEGRPKKELVHFYLLWVCSEGMRRHIEKSICWNRFKGVKDKLHGWRRSRRIWDYLIKRRRSCSQAQLQEVYHPFFLAVLLKDLHHNGNAFLEDHMAGTVRGRSPGISDWSPWR